jgi:serine/threonine-protein kinase Chk2
VQATVNGEKTPLEANKPAPIGAEEAYERTKVKGVSSGGYLIGRHPECGKY